MTKIGEELNKGTNMEKIKNHFKTFWAGFWRIAISIGVIHLIVMALINYSLIFVPLLIIGVIIVVSYVIGDLIRSEQEYNKKWKNRERY
jgi:ABC-type bacteriocin/lantibiotic exporter with double-glycine peptidase domain